MTMVKLKELMALKEMPKISKDIPLDIKQKLEDTLKTKFTEFDIFKNIEENSIGGGYYIIDGLQQYILDKWAAIIKKENEENIELCIGATFKRVNYLYSQKIESYQLMLVNKFANHPKRAASILYIYLAKKWNCAIFSDDRVTLGGKEIWRELLTRPNLEQEGVKIFVYDKKQRKEITNYGSVENLFGLDDKFEDIIVGIKPI